MGPPVRYDRGVERQVTVSNPYIPLHLEAGVKGPALLYVCAGTMAAVLMRDCCVNRCSHVRAALSLVTVPHPVQLPHPNLPSSRQLMRSVGRASHSKHERDT